MPNTFAPFGFRSFGHRDGSAPTMGLERLIINSSYGSSIFTGDVVVHSSGSPGTIEVSTGGLTTTIRPAGVFAGCEYYNSNVQRQVWSPYFPASVGSSSPVTAYVISDPEMTFVAQASTGAVVGSSMIGKQVSFTVGTGNTTTGVSGAHLLSTAVGALGSSYAWTVVDTYRSFGPPGANGTSSEAGQWLIVQPVNWMRNTLGLIGVST